MSEKDPVYFNISVIAIIKILLVLLVFYLLFLVRDILAVLFISLILSSALDPWVDWMKKRKIPRAVSVIFIYSILFIIVSSIIFLIVPPIVKEVGELSVSFPKIVEKVVSGVAALKEYSSKIGLLENLKDSLGAFTTNLQSATAGVFSTVTGIFGGIFTFFLILVITFYMVVEENAMKKIVWSIAPARHQVYIMHLINRMQKKVGLWMRGQIILSVIIFLLTFVGLSILRVEYALVLALIAGLTEFVPYLGPLLASIPAVFLSFTQAPTLAIFVAILYYIIQLVENNIIVPKLMQKVVGLNPIVSITVLLVGFKIAGVVGAILSIPVTTALNVFIQDMFDHKAAEEAEHL